MTAEKSPKQITASFILSWFFGVIFLIWTAVIFQNGNIASGLVVLLCALLLIPPVKQFISKKLNVQFSGGMVALVILVGFIFFSVAFDTSSDSETVDQSGDVVSAPVDWCPDMTVNTAYNFKWADSMNGNRMLYLEADFIGVAQFSDAWTLKNPPDISAYSTDTFVCKPGAEAGESTNKLYCTSTIFYKPELIKNTIDENGNITKSDYTEIESFIFDITGKDIQNNVDLDSLTLEKITCSSNSF